MTQNTGKPFERLTAAVQRKLSGPSDVIWNETINGRQIDVSIRGRIGTAEVLIIVECRDYASERIGIDHIDRLESVQRDVRANKAILATRIGFTKDALEKAARVGIDTCTLGPANREDFPDGANRECWGTIVPISVGLDGLTLELDDGRRLPTSPFAQLVDDDGKSDFVDVIIKSWLGHTDEGRQHPMGKELHLALTPPPRLLLDEEQPRVTKLHCLPSETRGPVIESLWKAPEEWVFRRILPDGTRTEEQFFRFDDLTQLAKLAIEGRPIP